MAGLRPDLLVPYQLRTVTVGVRSTVLVLVVLGLYVMLPSRREVSAELLLALMVVAGAGALVIHWLPWRRFFDEGHGQRLLYVWSVVNILLITGGIAVSGGIESDAWFIYGVVLVFCAASYPVWGQIALLVFTGVCYVILLVVLGDPLPPATLVIRLGGLGTIAFIAAFLASELARQMEQHASARAEADARAERFGAVAAAARSMQAPRADLVSHRFASAALDLGFDAALVAIDEADGPRVAASVGDPLIVARLEQYVGAAPLLRDEVTLDIDERDRSAGPMRAVLSPVQVDGGADAVLITARRGEPRTRPEERQALDLLCAVAGRALESSAYAARLRADEERYRALAEHSSEFVVVIDAGWRITEWSHSIERTTGVSAHDVIGRPLQEVLSADSGRDLFEALTEVEGYGSTLRPVLVSFTDRDGERRTVEVLIANLLSHPEVRGIVLNARDVTERQALAVELEWRRYRNALTGLPNRAGLIRTTAAWLGERRADEPTAVLFVNVENVTAINDLYGREAAEGLLRAVAERLSHALPLGLELAHIDGDQFAVLAPGHDVPAAEALAARLLTALTGRFELLGEPVLLGGAIGISQDVAGRQSAETLIEQAEVAAYVAKSDESKRIALFSESLQSERLAQIRLEHDLRRAIANDELSLVYQPIVELETGRVTSVEALLRWQHPERGAIPPRAFIPLAESSGVIVPLGAWVARRVCEQLATWREEDAGLAGTGISVNVSPLQLLDGTFASELEAWIDELALDAAQITLELTEETFAAQDSEVAGNVQRLRQLGVRVAVDDFGSGYSSFGYLQRFPVDCVKIDQSFVRSIGAEGGDLLLDAIVDVAHRLGLPVVAEGVEDPRQLEYLRRLGCEYVQGFLLSEPVALADVAEARDEAQTRLSRLAA